MPSFTRPPRVVGGNRQSIKAEHFNGLARCIEELQARLSKDAPQGGGRRAGSGYESVILPTKIWKHEDEWKVQFTSAKLFEHSMNDGGWEHDIKIADGKLTDTPKKSLTLEEGENHVWLKFKVLPNCEVELTTPEIVVGAEPPEENPFQPNRPKVLSTTPGEGEGDPPTYTYGSGGVTGNYRQKIGTITIEDGKPAIWKSVSPHALVWIGQTEWEDSEPGAGQSLYYQQAEGVDKFKVAKNADTEVEEGAEGVLNDEATPFSKHIVFARICQKDSDPQVHVKSEGENAARKIIIEGNSFNAAVSGAVKGLSVVDGLVTAVEEIPPEEGGWWGTEELHHEDENTPSNTMWLKKTYEAGRVVKVEVKYSSDPDYTEISGTEETPGAATFNTWNTDTA